MFGFWSQLICTTDVDGCVCSFTLLISTKTHIIFYFKFKISIGRHFNFDWYSFTELYENSHYFWCSVCTLPWGWLDKIRCGHFGSRGGGPRILPDFGDKNLTDSCRGSPRSGWTLSTRPREGPCSRAESGKCKIKFLIKFTRGFTIV